MLGEVIGEPALALLERDTALLQDRGLDNIEPQAVTALIEDYAATGSKAALEVIDWLRGEYAFDPACLTD